MIDFIQLGANIGKSYSDIMWWLVPQEGWSGIFVEPNPSAYKKLLENYFELNNCFFEKTAVIAKTYDEDLVVEDSEKSVIMRLGNSEHFHETSRVEPGQDPEVLTRRSKDFIEVPSTTLEKIVEKYDMTGKPFELLQVDIENSDYDVMITTDLSKVRPKYIRIETIHMESIDCLKGETCQIFPDTCALTRSSKKAHLDKFMQLNGYKMIDDPWYQHYEFLVTHQFTGKKPEPENFNTVYFNKFL